MKRKIVCLLLISTLALSGCGKSSASVKTSEKSSETEVSSKETIEVIDNVEQYSRISVDELKSLMGEPASLDSWTLSSPKGDFPVETFSYDKDSNHYEFIIADNAVVRLSIYSNMYWNNNGEAFSYEKDIRDICALFNITTTESTKVKTDNGFTYILSPVNDKVAEIDVQNIDANNSTFDFVKITYNLNYFD